MGKIRRVWVEKKWWMDSKCSWWLTRKRERSLWDERRANVGGSRSRIDGRGENTKV
jgi:hypothetical protein